MKTALESYLETATLVEKKKILAEQEMQMLKDFDVEAVLHPIQTGINLSIQNREFNRTITFVKSPIWTAHNGFIDVWHLARNRDYWEYNRNANGYYDISFASDIKMLDFSPVITALQDAGYQCKVKEILINEATSRTGKHSITRKAIEVNVDWRNSLTLIGAKGNG